MRKELDNIELIEKFLKNQLSASEKAAFEDKLINDPNFRNEVELQQELMQGIDRALLKQKIKKVYKKYTFKKNLIKWSIIIASATAIALGVLYFNMHREHSHSERYSNEAIEKDGKELVDADKYLPSQTFNINTNKDTVIETSAGMLLSIPANSFIDNNGNEVTGNYELEIKEALDPSSIMQAGLTTKSGDQLLETGGMFYIDAKKDNQVLKINSKNSPYIQVPTKNKRGDMKLFDGKRSPDGTIDWENPKDLENYLTPVDINTLNFYPPNYLDSLRRWGKDYRNKKYTDSLYFSFASLFVRSAAPAFSDSTRIKEELPTHPKRILDQLIDKVTVHSEGHGYVQGINPAKIKAIWSTQLQNTLISTKEFEERIPLIHGGCNNSILDLYINNMDQTLCHIDSLAARKTSGNVKDGFVKFSLRNDGKVDINSKAMKKLGEYFTKRTQSYTQAAAKTEREYQSKQRQLERDANYKKEKHQREDAAREYQNLMEEYDINLTEACRQLGIKKPNVISTNYYGTTLSSTGWKNLDAYVMESTLNRTTLDYTAENGKKAVIRYDPMSVSIKDHSTYDRVYVYLIPDKLTSFMRLKESENKFNEKLNELIQYDLICLAYKGDQPYFSTISDVKAINYEEIQLTQIDKKELDTKLNSLKNINQGNGMKKEVEYWESEIQEVKRKKVYADRMQFWYKVAEVILPCYSRPM